MSDINWSEVIKSFLPNGGKKQDSKASYESYQADKAAKENTIKALSANSAADTGKVSNPGSNGQYNDMVSSIGDGYSDFSAMDYNKWAYQNTLDWQERMSNTSHQREVADLKAAGLNPILSANGGASAYSGISSSADTSELGYKTSLLNTMINAQSAANVASIAASATRYASDNNYKSAIVGSPFATISNLIGLNSGKAIENYGKLVNATSKKLENYSAKLGNLAWWNLLK